MAPKDKKSDLIPTLKSAMEAGYNVMLTGIHGIGKTFAVEQAVEDLKWKMKYYSTSTLDPYVDLIGVPVPMATDTDEPWLKMVRPKEMDEVEVVFFDELNRADPRTLNAVLEIVQFRRINGEPLPNLKCVVAACNPPGEDYNVDELDPALLDRFHVYYDLSPKSPRPYLVTKYPKHLVDPFHSWWNGLNNEKREQYISPRRLDMMMDVYCKTGSLDLLEKSIPSSTKVDFAALKTRIAMAEGDQDLGDEIAEKAQNPGWWTRDTVGRHVPEIAEYLGKNPNDAIAVNNASEFILNCRIGANMITKQFGDLMVAIYAANPAKVEEWKIKWSKTKVSQIRGALRDMERSDKDYSKIAKAW